MVRETVGIVVDVNVFVDAALHFGTAPPDAGIQDAPAPPPVAGEAFVQTLRVVADGTIDGTQHLQLYVSRHVLSATRTVLVDKYDWLSERANAYVGFVLHGLARGPAAGYREPATVPAALKDYEDNHILALADQSGAQLLVTANWDDFAVDQHWRQRVMLQRPHEFVGMVDGARRQAGWKGGAPPTDVY